MRIAPSVFQRRDLRVHQLLRDVPLHDVWAIPLQGGNGNRTIADVSALFSFNTFASAHTSVKSLFHLREQLGTLFGWDVERPAWQADSYITRLTPADHERSLVMPGSAKGPFRMVYEFETEQLDEIRNATVHAFSSLSMHRVHDGHLVYWALFVKEVNWFTRPYMAAIDPFRRLLIYPFIIRKVQQAWIERYTPHYPFRITGGR